MSDVASAGVGEEAMDIPKFNIGHVQRDLAFWVENLLSQPVFGDADAV